MDKELRKQIRQDELVTGYESASAWVTVHQREVLATLIVAVVGLGGWALLSHLNATQAAEAEGEFSQALAIFEAPLQAELPQGADKPAGPVFGSAEEKFTKAAAGFDGVERKWGSLGVGRRARYFAALCRMELGQSDPARKALTEIAARREEGALEPYLAQFAVAELDRRSGPLDKAVDAYRKLADDPALPLPRDHALMTLGSLLEEAHRLPEARSAYKRLAQEFPASPYAQDAHRRAEYLATQG